MGCLPEAPRDPRAPPTVYQGWPWRSAQRGQTSALAGGMQEAAIVDVQVERPTGKRPGFQPEACTLAGHWMQQVPIPSQTYRTGAMADFLTRVSWRQEAVPLSQVPSAS